MGRARDLNGLRFGDLEVLSFHSRDKVTRHAKWLCKCVCGKEWAVLQDSLVQGKTKSCGCTKGKGERSGVLKHGLAHKTKTYNSWAHIKSRCYNVSNPNYSNYGGRGIVMHEDWKENFLSFYEAVGEAPCNSKDWSIDRIDTNKGYVPGNVRWARQIQQTRNRRKPSNNTTGVMGVYWRTIRGGLYAVASWKEPEGKRVNLMFSQRKYGLLPAFKMAVERRIAAIGRLQLIENGYMESHGK